MMSVCRHLTMLLLVTVLGISLASDDRPTLYELRRFPMKDGFKDIVAEIQNDYELLGTLLLEDRSGSVIRSIKTAECGSPPDITVGIFHQWLQGKGRQPVTWRALIECLRDTNLNVVAESIEDALSSEEGTCTTAQASTGSSMGRQQQPSFEGSGAEGIAQRNMEKIVGNFYTLLTMVRRKLREKPINAEDLKFLTNGIFQGEYIPKSSDINEIFESINRHRLWDYWNYYPLENIVLVFAVDDPEITLLMETYRQDLESYKVTTKIIDYIAAVNAKPSEEEEHEQPARYNRSYYQTLSLKLNTRVTNCSLKYIDDLWNKFANLYDLPSRVVLLDHIHRGCVLVVWLIPTHLAPQIHLAPLSDAFYRKHKITRVEFDGIRIYQEEEEHHDEVYMDKGRDKAESQGSLQITGHPQYQICPIAQPCPEKSETSPEQDKVCSRQDQPCPQQNKECSVCCVTAVFQCTATGTLPLTFTWWRNITNYSFMRRWIYSWWWETEGTVTEKVNSNDTCFIQMVNDGTSQLSFSNTSMPVFEEYFCEVSDACGQSSKSEPALLLVYEEGMSTGVKILLVVAIGAGAVAVPVAAPALLAALGFTGTGIVAGSLAATWQAKWGIGALFAATQSAGMAGFSVATYILLGLTGGAAGGGVTGLITWLLGEGDHCGLDEH